MIELKLDNDNLIKASGLRSGASGGSYINSSSGVTSKLLMLDGSTEVVASQALTYVAASNGDYEGTWNKTLLASSSVQPGLYILRIDVSEGGADGRWDAFADVQLRRE